MSHEPANSPLGPPPPATEAPVRSAFERIMAGLEEVLAHARGEHVPGLVVHEGWGGSTPKREGWDD